MKNILFLLSIWLIFMKPSHQNPVDDGQMIDGYGPDFADRELDPEEAEFERQQVNRLPLEFDSRAKRSVYKVLESAGLHSHFKDRGLKTIQDEEIVTSNPMRGRRVRRSPPSRSELHSDEVEDVDSEPRKISDDVSVEDVPQAEKHTMTPAYYRADDSRLMDKWVKAPYGDFQSRAHKDEGDNQPEASSNVGINSRTPRVNFITQQSRSAGGGKDEPDGPEAREKERERERERERDRDRDQQSGNKQPSDDGYRKPLNNDRDRYYPSTYNNYNKNYDVYPNQIPSTYDRNYDRYYGRDRYPEREIYPYSPYYPYTDRDLGYNERPPAGMSRMTPPMGPSSGYYYRHQYNDYDEYYPRSIPNYYYSDKRFDAPLLPMEPRDPYERDLYRPYLYTNDVNNRPGRIIYYANLPEISRPPGTYRSSRYGDPMYDDYRSLRTAKSAVYRDAPPSTTTMRISSSPVRSDTPRSRSYYQ